MIALCSGQQHAVAVVITHCVLVLYVCVCVCVYVCDFLRMCVCMCLLYEVLFQLTLNYCVVDAFDACLASARRTVFCGIAVGFSCRR